MFAFKNWHMPTTTEEYMNATQTKLTHKLQFEITTSVKLYGFTQHPPLPNNDANTLLSFFSKETIYM